MEELFNFLLAFQDRLPDDFAVDVLKSFVGTLLGAGLAFWFALRKDGLARLREQRAAGNAAIAAAARMTSDFAQVRFAIAEHRKQVLILQPSTPMWMLVKPTPFRHANELHFDTEALTFMFDHPNGPEVFSKLIDA